jgi:hypothetical protein
MRRAKKTFIMRAMTRLLPLLIAALCATAHAQAPAPKAPVAAEQTPAPFVFGPRTLRRAAEADPLVLRRDALSLSMAFAQRELPASREWNQAERALFEEVAAAGKYDVLVAPVQSEGYALDRISRSLIAAHLVAALRTRGYRVPSAHTVQRALGEGRRELHHEVAQLGQRLAVDRVVALAANHDRAGKLQLSVRVFEKRPPSGHMQAGLVQRLPSIELRENLHPAEIAQQAMPQIMRAAGISAAARKSAAKSPSGSGLPQSPAAAIASNLTDTEALASSLQLMATLASPLAAERARERLFEQALLAALALPDGHASAPLFRARAWRNLESRTSAMRALDGSARPEAVAYRELLNGNLPEFSAALSKVDNRFARLLLEIDLADLKQTYGMPQAAGQELLDLAKRYPGWMAILDQRIREFDPWWPGDVSLPWRLLDEHLPLVGAGFQEHLRGLSTIGRSPDMAAIAKGTLSHLRRLQREDESLRRCLDESPYCARGAYLDLVESLLISSIHRIAVLRGLRQGIDAEALQLLRGLEPEFEGQADLMLAGARVLANKASRGPEHERQADLAKARSAAATVAWLEQGASRTSHEALVLMGVGSAQSLPFLEAYFFDVPVRSYWPLHGGNATLGSPPGKDELRRVLRARLDAAVVEIDVVADAMAWTGAGGADLERGDVLRGRFHGHPARAQLLAWQRGASGPGASAGNERLAQLQATVRERPDLWSVHSDLATYYLEERGDYAEAYKAFMAFPGFKSRTGYGAVALSNHAYAAGSWFFWRGRLDEARAFYGIAADLDTGSLASIASETRLSLLDGDFRAATALSQARAQRYSDPYAYRDYLAWLFAFGFKEEAWTGFGQLHRAMRNPQVWLAADVGHRIEQRSWPEVRQWLLSEPFRSSAFNRDVHGLRLAILQSSVDRIPASDLTTSMLAIAGPAAAAAERTQDGMGALLTAHPMGEGGMLLPRSRFRLSERQPLKEGEKVVSHFVLFADAYVALRNGAYAAAVEKFDAMAAYYPLEGDEGFDAYALAYFSWASARSGDRLGLEKFVRELKSRAIQFDRGLSLAFFSGLRGEHEAALGHLKHAFNGRPHTERRPIPTEYQWAEACEWLFEATRERRYIDLALSWARLHQRIQPMMSWAYAFEAKHAADGSERIRALGIALHLDPNSERIARLPEELKRQARRHFEKNNSFDPSRAKAGTT